ncbi:TPR end-of-group domain-containing protein [Botryobacter ruber]|uniref:TPR end-of-group domain-containing protein n=1 Tax=Botryobacter ruber TaxID=2171629 RepID=UPI000E0AD994|nr:hypothetical protein [Botryobacter ruber]
MSKHTYLLLIKSLLLLLLCCSAGHSAFAAPDYTKVYHPVINNAELSIVAADYEAALQHYKAAFAAVPEPFAKDYYNAAACAVLAGDESRAYKYLKELVQKGVELEYLQKQEAFAPLHDTRKWRKLVKKYPKTRKKFTENANLDLRADLDELYARDQYFRQAAGGLRVYGDTLRKIETANTEILLNLIKQHGYPGEALIGVADTMELLPRFSIVIQRQTKALNGHDFTTILTDAVRQGRIAPHAAAYLIEQQQTNDLYKVRALVKVACTKPKDCEKDPKLADINKYQTEKLTEQQEQQVNKLRLALGMEPLADYRKKVHYGLNDKRFKLEYTGAVANYIVPSKEAAKVMLEGLVAVE